MLLTLEVNKCDKESSNNPRHTKGGEDESPPAAATVSPARSLILAAAWSAGPRQATCPPPESPEIAESLASPLPETTTLPVTAALTETLPTSPPPALRLASQPAYLLPDKEIALSWELANWTESLEELSLAWELAPGFIPVEIKDGFDPATGKLILPLPGLAGELRLAPPELLPDAAVFVLRLLQKDEPVLETKLSLKPLLLQSISSSGGAVHSPDGRVTVQFPPGAVSELKVSVASPRAQGLPYSLSGAPFEVLASDAASLAEVSQFSQPLTITLTYSDTDFLGDESTLKLFY